MLEPHPFYSLAWCGSSYKACMSCSNVDQNQSVTTTHYVTFAVWIRPKEPRLCSSVNHDCWAHVFRWRGVHWSHWGISQPVPLALCLAKRRSWWWWRAVFARGEKFCLSDRAVWPWCPVPPQQAWEHLVIDGTPPGTSALRTTGEEPDARWKGGEGREKSHQVALVVL